MTERFLIWAEHVKKFEGGYANNVFDKGKETMCGCCRMYHPHLKVWNSLDALRTKAEKKKYQPTQEEWNELYEVYYKNYWLPVKADYFDDINVSMQLADFGFGSGTVTAIKQLQKMLGITVDGKVGPQTIGTANAQPRVYQRLKETRDEFYRNIVRRDPTQEIFLKGWLRRSEECHI